MTTTAQPEVGRATGTRISSYLLVEYLERIGVDVVFGLCGHTNIAFLDALSKSRIRFLTSRYRRIQQTATRASPASRESCSATSVRD